MPSIYPSIPVPGNDTASQLATLRALRQAVELLVANATGVTTASGVGSATQVFALADNVNTLIQSEEAARAAADTTAAQNLNTLENSINREVQSLNSDVARAFEDLAGITTRVTDAESNIGNNSAAITREVGARATADTALSGRIDTISATVGDNTTAIQSEAVARADADSSLGSRIDTVSTAVGDNTTAITNEVSARTTAVQGVANQVSTLSTTVSGHTTSIATNATAISNIGARYSVTLSTNGYVSGFSLLNGGGTESQFKILASRFIVAVPATSTQPANERQVFTVANNRVQIDGSIIATGSIAASSLSVNTLSAISANMGTITAGTIVISDAT